jgi:hypothetical protein
MNKHSSLQQTFVNYDRKKFYNIGPRRQCLYYPGGDVIKLFCFVTDEEAK